MCCKVLAAEREVLCGEGLGPKRGGGVFTYTLYGKTEGTRTWLVWWREMWLGYGGISHILITYRILYVPDLLAIIFLPWTVSFSIYIEMLEAVLLRLRGICGFLTRISFKMFSFIIAPLRKAVFTDNQPVMTTSSREWLKIAFPMNFPLLCNNLGMCWRIIYPPFVPSIKFNKDTLLTKKWRICLDLILKNIL